MTELRIVLAQVYGGIYSLVTTNITLWHCLVHLTRQQITLNCFFLHSHHLNCHVVVFHIIAQSHFLSRKRRALKLIAAIYRKLDTFPAIQRSMQSVDEESLEGGSGSSYYTWHTMGPGCAI